MSCCAPHHSEQAMNGAAGVDGGGTDTGTIEQTDKDTTDQDGESEGDNKSVKRLCFLFPYPPSIAFLLVYTFFQAYAYYGVSSILVLFFSSHLGYSDSASVSFVHYFLSATFFFSIPGGLIADRIGKFLAIALSLALWIIGHSGVTAASWEDFAGWSYLAYFVFPALGLLAVGKGIVTPANSGILGDQMPVKSLEDEARASSAYAWFYWAISFGSLLSKWITPYVRTHVEGNYFTAFGITDASLVLGALVFTAGYLSYDHCRKGKNALVDVTKVIYAALKYRNLQYIDFNPPGSPSIRVNNGDENDHPHDEGQGLLQEHGSRLYGGTGSWKNRGSKKSWLDKAKLAYPEGMVEDVKAVVSVSWVFLPLPIFWSLFFQTYSTWVFQAQQMNKTVAGYRFCPDQTQTLNPLMDMILIPIFNYIVFPLLRKIGVRVTTLRRMVIGMLCASLSFVAAALLQREIDSAGPGKVSVLWQMPQYWLLSCAEVLFSIAGLEFAYSEAPTTMKTAMQALWYFEVGLGNILVAFFSYVNFCAAYCQFFTFAGLMFGFMLVFIVIAWRYTYTVRVVAPTFPGGRQEDLQHHERERTSRSRTLHEASFVLH